MPERKFSTLEKIREINPGIISDNMMIARLNRILKESKPSEKVNTVDANHLQKSPQELQQASLELGQLLSKGQPLEEYRQQLKTKYLSQYLNKFGVESPQNTQPKQQSVLSQLEQFKQRIQEREKSLGKTQRQSEALLEVRSPDDSKKSFIRTVMDNIITKGKSLGNQIRGYDVNGYKTQLEIQDNKQVVSVERSNPQATQTNPAFKAEKEGSKEFNILQDNLSQQEAKEITDLAEQQQQRQLQSRLQQRKQQQKNNSPEIGD
ncbi:hypothetical protein FNW02_32315 [Komarekiella sp. 'clone 1']|uniref:Uncharacterized protein n=1 Tax=Komarekiella delphini-convector SJRDD-AB1 TaxID=2593771 RepID=A0AA40T3M5_9NOST|nr:hypothetical protein [Komarekiella delphini-convector]MBD6620343.1 hypothetical protein [Komarekiella delphini-convector SJRDD-AB1]